MTTLELLLAVTFTLPAPSMLVAAPAADEAPAPGEAGDEADLREAQRLFNEGLARYEAADFSGAIETFTLALSEVRDQGIDDFSILGPLLYNIGRSHVRAYEIDRSIEHLRQADAIFTRFIDASEAAPDQSYEADVADARAQLEQLREQIAEQEHGPLPVEVESETNPGSAPAEDPPATDRSGDATRARKLGIGLSVAGAALIGGGVGALVWGLGYGPAAAAEVAEFDTQGLPEDHPLFDARETYLADERRKGTIWMAAGGAAAALGLTGVAIGVAQLVKAKRLQGPGAQLEPTASFGPGHALLGLSGRF